MVDIIKDSINENLDEVITPNGSLKVGGNYIYTVGETGGLMELLPEGSFYMQLVSEEINEIDIENFRYGDISFKVLLNQDKVYMLIRFGNGTLLYEILFNPTLYPDKERTKEALLKSNIVHAVFIDKNSGKIQGLKRFNFPIKTYEKLIEAWVKALENKDYTEEYQEYCTSFFGQDIGYWWDAIL